MFLNQIYFKIYFYQIDNTKGVRFVLASTGINGGLMTP